MGEDMGEEGGRRRVCGFAWWYVLVRVSMSQSVCVCDARRQTDSYRDKGKQIQRGGGSFSVGSGKEASAGHCSLWCIPAETW